MSDSLPPPLAEVVNPRLPDGDKLLRVPLEWVYKAVEADVPVAARTAIQAEFAAYWGKPQHPLLVSNQLMDRLGTAVWPQLTQAETRRRLGQAFMGQFLTSIVGRVINVAVPLMSNERIMRRLPRDYSAIRNFGIYRIYQLAPSHWCLTAEDDPSYYDGVLGCFDAVREHSWRRPILIAGQIISLSQYRLEFRWD